MEIVNSRNVAARVQRHHDTKPERYPNLFADIVNTYARKGSLPGKILSFGCSEGDECVSMRKRFPAAKVYGADISNEIIEAARRKTADDNIDFFISSSESIEKRGPFDLILCLSVFCRYPEALDITDCQDIFPFSAFDEYVGFLVEQLNIGGLIVIHNAMHLVRFTTPYIGGKIAPISGRATYNGFVEKFCPNNKKYSSYDEANVRQRVIRDDPPVDEAVDFKVNIFERAL